MEQINFRILNTNNNMLTLKAYGINPNCKGKYIYVSISMIQFPYLQGNIYKIKKAMGFIK